MRDGFLNLLKPPGMTSSEAVVMVRKTLPRGAKVGHMGTLDPEASGVLPIGIGQLGTDTPENWVTTVQRKRANPTWTPTAKVRADYAAKGDPLPAVWPAGPDNPMGLYALYIGRLYAIHGTNRPESIGKFASYGCIRMLNEDIVDLFDRVTVGTPVTVRR